MFEMHIFNSDKLGSSSCSTPTLERSSLGVFETFPSMYAISSLGIFYFSVKTFGFPIVPNNVSASVTFGNIDPNGVWESLLDTRLDIWLEAMTGIGPCAN